MSNTKSIIWVACALAGLSVWGIIVRIFIPIEIPVEMLSGAESGTFVVEGFLQETRERDSFVLSNGESAAISVQGERITLRKYPNIEVINPKRRGRAVVRKNGGWVSLVSFSEYKVVNPLSRDLNNGEIIEPIQPSGLEERTKQSYIDQQEKAAVDRVFDWRR